MSSTPGPWIIRSRGEGAEPVTLEAPEHIVLPHTFTEQTDGMTEVVAFVDAEANARLIAAAPDLLAACEAAVEAIEQNIDDEDTDDGAPTWAQALHMQLESAISKARGHQ